MVPGSKKLRSAKKEAWARKIALEKMGLSDAYRAVYDASGMKATSINSNAKKLKRETPVALRIDYLQEHGLAEQDGPGRPTDFRESYCGIAKHLTLLGHVDTELAEFFGCSESTLNKWKLKHPQFAESIKDGKVFADAEVAVKTRERAMGFQYEEAHPIKLRTVEYKDGKKVAETERVEIVTTTKVVPPDTTAGIFWLTNRQRKYWKQRSNVEATGADGAPLVPDSSSSRDMARAVFDILRQAKTETGTKNAPKPRGRRGPRRPDSRSPRQHPAAPAGGAVQREDRVRSQAQVRDGGPLQAEEADPPRVR